MKPIFIVGVPRSGTKLLREILNRNEEVSIPKAETHFLPYIYNKWRARQFLSFDEIISFYQLFTDSSFFYHIDSAEKIWPKKLFFQNYSKMNISKLLEMIFTVHAEKEGKKRWGDKTPEYILCTDIIKEIFPHACFVHIIRDVRDCCLSAKKVWKKSTLRTAQKWVYSVETILQNKDKYISDYYEIKYENLIKKPADEVSKLCSWLNIKYNDEMLRVNDNIERYGDAKNRYGVLKDNFQKWDGNISRYELKRIEEIAGNTIYKLNYPLKHRPTFKPLKRSENIFYFTIDCINLIRFRIKDYGSIKKAILRFISDIKMKI